MEKKDFLLMTDDELLIEKRKLKKAKIFHAFSIGFLAGILLFGIVSWSLSADKKIGFFIPMLIPIVFIYKMLKSPKTNKDLEEALKERRL